MKAVILAAGKGTRMGPLTESKPKVMLPIANKPLLEHIIVYLKAVGIREFLIVIGYGKDRIKKYFKDWRNKVKKIDKSAHVEFSKFSRQEQTFTY